MSETLVSDQWPEKPNPTPSHLSRGLLNCVYFSVEAPQEAEQGLGVNPMCPLSCDSVS